MKESDEYEEGRSAANRSIVHKTTLHEMDNNRGLEGTTVEERIEMVWQLTLDSWASMGEPVDEQRLQRDIVRVIRRGS